MDSVERAYFASNYSTGRAAASLTSTAMVPETTSDRILLDRNQRMYDAIKTKGYAQIKTNLGDINIELFCDQVREISDGKSQVLMPSIDSRDVS